MLFNNITGMMECDMFVCMSAENIVISASAGDVVD